MRWTTAPVALAAFFVPTTTAQSPIPEPDLGADVRGVFAARCAACHGPDLVKPKGRFGYVLDLHKVANNPEMVIPSRPDESELWTLISRNEMPPSDSPQGPLTASEKERVRAWIAAGAPDARPATASAPSAGASDTSTDHVPAAPLPTTERTLRWLGKLHLLVLHFPIALMLAAGAGELMSIAKRSRVPSPAVQFCVTLAALAVVPTVIFGWLFAASGNGVGSSQLLFAHRWLGTATGVWVLITALGAERDSYRGLRGWDVRVELAIGAVLVGLTAHIGGLMEHGADFFAW